MNNNTMCRTRSNRPFQRRDSRLHPRYLGEQGTLTGSLSRNPLVYQNRDGSRTYLLRMDVESRTGNPNNDQLAHTALLKAYVPEGHKDYCAALRKGARVTVRYVVQTDYYLDKAGCSAKKTFLSAKAVYSLAGTRGPRRDRFRPHPAPAGGDPGIGKE